ncbi:hypothetical protein VTK26DRAFT_2404 [Humicola hyalothermophila]
MDDGSVVPAVGEEGRGGIAKDDADGGEGQSGQRELARAESSLSRQESFYRWPRHTILGGPGEGAGEDEAVSPIAESPVFVLASPVLADPSRAASADGTPRGDEDLLSGRLSTGTSAATPDMIDSPSSVYDECGGNPFADEEEDKEDEWGWEWEREDAEEEARMYGLKEWNVDGILQEYADRERDALRELWGAVDALLGPGSGLGDYDATSTIDTTGTIGWDRMVFA